LPTGGNRDKKRAGKCEAQRDIDRLTRCEFEYMHIRDFQQLVSQKYEQRDRQRGTPATFMWFIEEVGELATALAKNNQQNKEEEFADVFAWLCTLANINAVDIEKACNKYVKNPPKGFK